MFILMKMSKIRRKKMKEIQIREFNTKTASEKEWQLFQQLFAPLWKEFYPEEPLFTVQDTKTVLSNFPDIWVRHFLVATIGDEKEFVGFTDLSFRKNEDKAAFIHVRVAKKVRRKGIAKILLRKTLEFAKKNERDFFTFSTMSSVVDGVEFARHLNMNLGLSTSYSMLNFKEIDIDLMKKWRSTLDENEFEIGFWHYPYPEDEIEEYVKMENNFHRSVPLDDLDYEPKTVSAEELRQKMIAFKEKSLEKPVVWVKDRKTKEFAGYTDVIVVLKRPFKIDQISTIVLNKYRRNGIGRAIKAEMILKLTELHPKAEYIMTANAKSNNSMLNINREMGFKHHVTMDYWQISLENLKKYLNGGK